MRLRHKLSELQKKYPQHKLRALVIEDSNLNFAITGRKEVGVLTIESNVYKGIWWQQITQDKTAQNDHSALRVELIVDEQEFMLSSSRSLYLIREYGI